MPRQCYRLDRDDVTASSCYPSQPHRIRNEGLCRPQHILQNFMAKSAGNVFFMSVMMHSDSPQSQAYQLDLIMTNLERESIGLD